QQQMAYASITKLDKFNSEENDAQVWLNNILLMHGIKASLSNPKILMDSKLNSCGDTETITIYLECFHRNLHQIQAIQADYFTAPQILNQFIKGLCSSILQRVCPIHPMDFSTAVTYAKDFEAAELKANHAQVINLAINELSKLDSKLKQFRSCQWNLGTSPTQNLNSQHYLSLLVTPEDATSSNQGIEQQQPPTNNIPSATITKNEFLDVIFPFKLEEPSDMPLFSEAALEEKLITAMYTDAKVDGHPIKLILDSGSTGSIITRQLMDQLGHRVNCAASARIITADGATKIPISKIDDFTIKVNGITIPIKVLMMKATQYQALVDNNWLFKTNAMLNWTTQELQLSQNGQHTQVPAICGHFKPSNVRTTTLFIKFKEEENKPTWEAYQVSWADVDHNELPPILSWNNNDNGKKKQRAELT
ncbi:hypothetical protein G9A89_008606, partial [Geosiphon pyriformis]